MHYRESGRPLFSEPGWYYFEEPEELAKAYFDETAFLLCCFSIYLDNSKLRAS